METLKEHLKAKRLKQTDFAAKVGISTTQLNMIVNGRRAPSLDVALRIRDATKGKVSVDSLNVEKR